MLKKYFSLVLPKVCVCVCVRVHTHYIEKCRYIFIHIVRERPVAKGTAERMLPLCSEDK